MAAEEETKKRGLLPLLLVINLLVVVYLLAPKDLFTAEEEEVEDEEEVREGESEISTPRDPNRYNPYANCGCPKTWEPVCAKIPSNPEETDFVEITIPNECEAKCQKIESYTTGQQCSSQALSHIGRARCIWEKCPSLSADTIKPVCWVGEQKLMRCHAECSAEWEYPDIKDFDPDTDITLGECSNPCLDDPCAETGLECMAPFGKCQTANKPCPTYYCVTKEEDCVCDEDDWSPVCSNNGQTFTNLCFAKCMALDVGATKGVCPRDKRDPYFPYPYPIGPKKNNRYELHVHEL